MDTSLILIQFAQATDGGSLTSVHSEVLSGREVGVCILYGGC